MWTVTYTHTHTDARTYVHSHSHTHRQRPRGSQFFKTFTHRRRICCWMVSTFCCWVKSNWNMAKRQSKATPKAEIPRVLFSLPDFCCFFAFLCETFNDILNFPNTFCVCLLHLFKHTRLTHTDTKANTHTLTYSDEFFAFVVIAFVALTRTRTYTCTLTTLTLNLSLTFLLLGCSCCYCCVRNWQIVRQNLWL